MQSEKINSEVWKLKNIISKLRNIKQLSVIKSNDSFDPDIMDNSDKYDGVYDDEFNSFLLKFRLVNCEDERHINEIERLKRNDQVTIVRKKDESYDFVILDSNGNSIGNIPQEISDAIVNLYASNNIIFDSSRINYIEPLSKRNKHARLPIVFIEIKGKVVNSE